MAFGLCCLDDFCLTKAKIGILAGSVRIRALKDKYGDSGLDETESRMTVFRGGFFGCNGLGMTAFVSKDLAVCRTVGRANV